MFLPLLNAKERTERNRMGLCAGGFVAVMLMLVLVSGASNPPRIDVAARQTPAGSGLN